MDDKLRNSLDQLNEEETSNLLDKEIKFEIDKKAVARIKASTFKKAHVSKRSFIFSRKFIACASAIMLVFCTIFALGFDNISAAVQQAIEYIPGFGKAPEMDSISPQDPINAVFEVKVMKEPVYLEVQGEKVQVYSCWMSIYKDQVIVTAILRYPQNITLNGEIVLEYNKEKISRDSEFGDFSSLDNPNKNKEMTYTYTIRNPKPPINTLTFKIDNTLTSTMEDSKVDIAFKKTEDLKDKVISQNFDGIIVSAIPLNPERSKFILTSTYEKNLEGVMFISSLATRIDSKIKAVDEVGNEYDIKKSTDQGSEYYVDGNIKGKIVSLKFNKLYQGFAYKSNKAMKGIKFKVPQVGEKVNINKSLDNSLSIINLKTVEKVNSIEKREEDMCRLLFTYEMKSKIPALDVFYIGLYVEKTGGVMGGWPLEKYKEGDSYIVKYCVYADKNATDNTVTIVPYGGYYWNTLLLDKECILRFQ